MENIIQRGDIYYYDFGENEGSIQSGYRPVLCIQSDSFNLKAPTVIVAAITSVIKKRYLPSHIILPDNTGLKQSSMVLLEQIRAVNKSDLKNKAGYLGDKQIWRQIDNAIKNTFGLVNEQRNKNESIRCLCANCMMDYIRSGKYIVKRLDPFEKVKDRCFKCNNLGYDYIVYERKHNV